VISGDGDQVTTRSERVIAGRYLLHDVLGRGGMGTVWRAHDQLLDRPVAAKELHVLTDGDEDHRVRVRRAIREARAVARVPHPHVVAVHDLVESEGSSLANRTAETGPLTPQQTAAVGLQLIDALDAVHAVGTLHRDIKPANVLLRRDGSAVLTDFGIAALDDGEFLTSTGQVVGSLKLSPPLGKPREGDSCLHRCGRLDGFTRPTTAPSGGRDLHDDVADPVQVQDVPGRVPVGVALEAAVGVLAREELLGLSAAWRDEAAC
jgi:serine/threonine protein kinase